LLKLLSVLHGQILFSSTPATSYDVRLLVYSDGENYPKCCSKKTNGGMKVKPYFTTNKRYIIMSKNKNIPIWETKWHFFQIFIQLLLTKMVLGYIMGSIVEDFNLC